MSLNVWVSLLAVVIMLLLLLNASWRFFIKHKKNYFNVILWVPVFVVFPILDLVRELKLLPADSVTIIFVLLMIGLIFYLPYVIIQFRRNNGEISKSK